MFSVQSGWLEVMFCMSVLAGKWFLWLLNASCLRPRSIYSFEKRNTIKKVRRTVHGKLSAGVSFGLSGCSFSSKKVKERKTFLWNSSSAFLWFEQPHRKTSQRNRTCEIPLENIYLLKGNHFKLFLKKLHFIGLGKTKKTQIRYYVQHYACRNL
jgi:hypothetical protein